MIFCFNTSPLPELQNCRFPDDKRGCHLPPRSIVGSDFHRRLVQSFRYVYYISKQTFYNNVSIEVRKQYIRAGSVKERERDRERGGRERERGGR